MSFGDRLRECRKARGLSQAELGEILGIAQTTIGSYESGNSFPGEKILLRLFDCLDTEPNILFQDFFQKGARILGPTEERLLENYRGLSPVGRETVRTVVDALCHYRDELEASRPQKQPYREIPLYCTPAAAGYTSPVFGEDFECLTVTDEVPQGAEYAVKIQGDSMTPYIADGSVVYVNRDPLKDGDVGIFCVDGDIFCKQYYKDPLGVVFLFSLNRSRSDADIVLTPGGGRALTCLGRVMMHALPLPGKE